MDFTTLGQRTRRAGCYRLCVDRTELKNIVESRGTMVSARVLSAFRLNQFKMTASFRASDSCLMLDYVCVINFRIIIIIIIIID